MFTGLVEKKGTIKSVSKSGGGLILKVRAVGFDDLKVGDSVAIDGVCQTLTELNGDEFSVFVMNETLKLTTLGALKAGDGVNLEHSMPANGRFGGHFVSGHVDGVAKLISIKKDGGANVLRFEYETKYIVKKGSIALNGVSLTVSEVSDAPRGSAGGYFEVSLIPHSFENTNLGALQTGDSVNVEVDIIAKYIEKFVQESNNTRGNNSKIDDNFLMEHGFV